MSLFWKCFIGQNFLEHHVNNKDLFYKESKKYLTLLKLKVARRAQVHLQLQRPAAISSSRTVPIWPNYEQILISFFCSSALCSSFIASLPPNQFFHNLCPSWQCITPIIALRLHDPIFLFWGSLKDYLDEIRPKRFCKRLSLPLRLPMLLKWHVPKPKDSVALVIAHLHVHERMRESQTGWRPLRSDVVFDFSHISFYMDFQQIWYVGFPDRSYTYQTPYLIIQLSILICSSGCWRRSEIVAVESALE